MKTKTLSTVSAAAALAVISSITFGLTGGSAGAQGGLTTDVQATDTGGTEPGTVVPLGTVDVEPSLIGQSCNGTFQAVNNSSVWPGNDITVTSGSGQVVLAGVEDEAAVEVNGSGTMVLGSTVQIDLVVGPTGRYSIGGIISFDCETPEPTPTEPPPTAAPTTPVTTPSIPAPTPSAEVPTQVEGSVEFAQPAQPVDTAPTFTG